MFKFRKKAVEEKKEVVAKALPRWGALSEAIKNAVESPPRFYPAPQLPQGVVPDGVDIMAMDGFCTASDYIGFDAQFYSSYLGYQVLSELSQSTEYRLVAETYAHEMTREWGEVKGEDQDKIEAIEAEFKRLGIRQLIRRSIELDCLFGGSQFYIDIEDQSDKTDLPLIMDEKGIKKGSLNGFTLHEPMWSTPSVYNAHNALAKDFFVPSHWWVLGQDVHASRLIPLTMRPVSDMLKPAYNFYGVAMSQLMLPYVQRLQSTLDSTAKLIEAFSLTILKTDMTPILSGQEGGVGEMVKRTKAFTAMRKNDGILMVDKNGEDIEQINTPLSGLDALINIMVQMVAYPSKIPVLKLFGTPTAGLGNTGDGEIRVFYDAVSAQQEAFILPIINKMLKCVQLSLFGEIDKDIEFRFNPLYQLDDNERADVNLKKAQRDQILIQEGIIDNDEARQNLNEDENSGYQLEGNAPERLDPYAEVVDE